MFTTPKYEIRSMPSLVERRNNLIAEMEGLIDKAKKETRSFDDQESKRFEEIKTEVTKIDKTVQAEQEAEKLSAKQQAKQSGKTEEEEKRALDEANFLNYVKGDLRALEVANNGAVIPTDIASRIITRVKELSPIYSRATVFNVGGDLVFPSFDVNSIVTGYIADLTELTEQNGNFTSRKLQNFIAGSLVLLSRSLMNRTDFDLVSFIVNSMAQSMSTFIEKELLTGAGVTSATGIFTDGNVTGLQTAGIGAVTSDDLISQQMSIPEAFQNEAIWIMSKPMFTSFRKFKDTTGTYILNPDVRTGFGWELLGKRVFVSENAPDDAVAYGDMSGLFVKVAQNVEMQLLNEKYATRHATGICSYMEFDSRIIEDQKISVMEVKTA
jgi:HK97 family phage major capsid protein